MRVLLTRFVEDESGATVIEYGLIAAGISVAIISVISCRASVPSDEVTISQFTAEQVHASVGDRLKVYLPNVNEARDFTVVGTVGSSLKTTFTSVQTAIK